jgi:hypothetical protein
MSLGVVVTQRLGLREVSDTWQKAVDRNFDIRGGG